MTTNTDSLTGKEAFAQNARDLERYRIMADHFEKHLRSKEDQGNSVEPTRLSGRRKNYEAINDLINSRVLDQDPELRERFKSILRKTGVDPLPSDLLSNVREYGLKQGLAYNGFLVESMLIENPRLNRAHQVGAGLTHSLIDLSKTDFVEGQAGKALSLLTRGAAYLASPIAYVTGAIASAFGEGAETIDSLDTRLNSNGETR